MSYQLDFNGRIVLDPISINKVNRYYTNQQEFLREPAVLSSRSKKGELLYLVTIPFDAQDAVSMTKMVDVINMCRAFPYAFIKCDEMEDPMASIGKQAIGDGYFMYAIHEYEVEVSSDDQGVFLFSIRLQPINWRALTKEIYFLSINELETSATGSEKEYGFTYHSNPGESNILAKMVDYYGKDRERYASRLTLPAGSKGHELTFGVPVVSTTTEQASQVKNKVGDDRIFRIFHPVDASNTDNEVDNIKTSNPNVSEITNAAKTEAEEQSRVIVSYSGHSIGSDESNSIISMVVRRRNRFINQTVVDMVLPYAQYLGKSPSEVLISVATNNDSSGGGLSVASRIIDAMNSFIDVVKSAYPYLTSIDAFRIENPLTKVMGVDYAILDSSQVSATSDMNNVSICNYTLIESNQSSMLERSKYTLASSDSAQSTGDRIDTLLRMIDIVQKENKAGNNTPEIEALKQQILRIYPSIESQIKSDQQLIATNWKAKGQRVLGDLSASSSFKASGQLSKTKQALEYVSKNYSKPSEGMSASEWRVINEKIRAISSAINNTYNTVISKNSTNKYVQELVVRDVMAEQERINQYGDTIILSGEAAPDLFIGEIFKDIPKIEGLDSWRALSTLPFVYDKPEIDPAKLRSMWSSEKDRIDAAYKPLEGYLAGAYGAESRIPKYNGQTIGTISDYDARLQSGPSSEVNASEIAGKTSATNAPVPMSSSGWLTYNQVFPNMRVTSPFGKIRKKSSAPGLRFHGGIDMANPGCVGKPVYAAADGVAEARVDPKGYGNWVKIRHTGNNSSFETRYGHFVRHAFRGTKNVKAGEVIGYCGNTGRSEGAHLHYEIRYKNVVLDPVRFIRNDTNTWYTTGALTRLHQISTRKYNPGVSVPASKASSAIQNTTSTAAQNTITKSVVANTTSANKTTQTSTSSSSVGSAISQAVSILREYEGFLPKAKWDVNAYRLGYGSDTITTATGQIIKVTAGSTVTRADAERDLTRRARIYYESARNSIGSSYWDKLTPNAQAAITSIAYNYGSINKSSHSNLIAAARSGNSDSIASAIAALGSHNNGVNKKRRNKEAQLVRSGGSKTTVQTPLAGADTLDELAAYKSGEYQKFEMNPVPWNEELQAESRIANLAKDFSIGVQKLIPTYKVYLVYGNDENSLYYMLNSNLNPKLYELPSIRNIKVEMANQDNPVSSAYFEVLNPMNTAVSPQVTNQNAPSHKLDITALGSDFADINVYDQIRLKAGNKIQIRLGYGNDPSSLDVVFNGLITETTTGDVVRVVAEGYGRELENELLFGIDTSVLGGIGDNQYISFKVGQILKNANLQHFGRTAKIFGDREGQMGQTVADQNGLNTYGFDYRNSLWDSSSNSYFMYDFMGASDTVENYFLTSIDVVDASILSPSSGFFSRLTDLLPFSRDDFIRDFKITNKTVWETIRTGRRLFPSSVSLVKDIGARCTTFVGIKEQMMYKYNTSNKLLQGISENIDKEVRAENVSNPLPNNGAGDKSLEAGRIAAGMAMFGWLFDKTKSADDMLKEAQEANSEQTAKLTLMLKDYYTAPDNAWKPATNFHIISSSYNLLSNQLKLNANLTTGVQVEYGGEELYEYGTGELDTFELKANGNLHPAFVSYELYSDSTIGTKALAQRTASGFLLEELEKAYDGAVIICGNATVAPGDYAFLTDASRGMVGVIKCREVHHVFSEQDGYITIITPGMFVEPATHLYSTLYFKLSLFYAMVAQGLEESRLYYSAYAPASLSFASITMSDEIYSNFAPVAGAALNSAVGAGTAYGTYRAGSMLVNSLPGATQTAWQRAMASQLGRNVATGSVGRSVASAASYASRIIGPASTAGSRVLGMSRMAAAAASATPPGIVATIIGSLALGMLGNLYDSYSSSVKLQHRALLKFPLMVYGKEYQPGLRGWNDTKGILEVQWDNIKTTARNAGLLYDAASSNVEKGVSWRILGKLLSD